jgi:hypothetical protein
MSGEDRFEALLSDAGPRAVLPDEDLAVIRDAARAEWRRRYGSRAARPRVAGWIPLAAAAAIVAAAAGLLWRARTAAPAAAPPPNVASVERTADGSPWQVGNVLPAGTGVTTDAAGHLALRMVGGASARLDRGTRLTLASSTSIELAQGAVYVDTAGGEPIQVRAPAGVVRPTGTQFEVRVADGVTRVKVREGTVRLESGSDSTGAAAGEDLVVAAEGKVSRRPIPPFGPEWDWVLASAPVPAIEGMKVRKFLDWIGRESGRRIELADVETAALADSVELHGSVAHLTPFDATGVVLSSAGLEYRVSNGAIVISVTRKKR